MKNNEIKKVPIHFVSICYVVEKRKEGRGVAGRVMRQTNLRVGTVLWRTQGQSLRIFFSVWPLKINLVPTMQHYEEEFIFTELIMLLL